MSLGRLMSVLGLVVFAVGCATAVAVEANNVSAEPDAIRVSCVGDSITFGAGIANRDADSYPAQLQSLLGSKYEVGNFGLSGARVTRNSPRPYIGCKQYNEALAFSPNIVVICLGVNDCSVGEWQNNKADFENDYNRLISDLAGLPTSPRILLGTLLPVVPPYEPYAAIQKNIEECQVMIERIAKRHGLPLIDLFTRLNMEPQLFPDGLHPRKEGATILAQAVCKAITGQHGGLQMPWIFADHMVLQQNMPIPVFGTADSKSNITVEINGNTAHATANCNGKWRVDLPAMKVGKPHTMTVTDGKTTLTFNDVLVGEVWIAAGQSNMGWQFDQDTDWNTQGPLADNHPNIRVLNRAVIPSAGYRNWSQEEMDAVTVDKSFEGTWAVGSQASAGRFSAVGYYFAKQIHTATDIPIGIIDIAVGGTSMESYMPRAALATPDLYLLTKDWIFSPIATSWHRGVAADNLDLWFKGPKTTPMPHHIFEPCFLYHCTVHQIMPFAIRGVVWYQGETNSVDTLDDQSWGQEKNHKLFDNLITSWRKNWGQGDFPFYYVQLPNMNRYWMLFREMQLQILDELPNLGMAVAIDIGDPEDIHPKSKIEVGRRLGLWARAKLYGEKDLVYSGPLFNSTFIDEGKTLRVGFDHADGLKARDGKEIIGFEIAGSDGAWKTAKASVSGNQIILEGDDVLDPQAARYAWAPVPEANLVNCANLPASPFRAGKCIFSAKYTENSTDSFERYPVGQFPTPLIGPLGEWTVTNGQAEIVRGRANTGIGSLRILGGKDSQAKLQLAKPAQNVNLSFSAERWTKRPPFDFSVEIHKGNEWKTVFSDKGELVKVKGFNAHIELTIEDYFDAVRFNCTAPSRGGVLIDDVTVLPLIPMKVTRVTTEQPILPALIGNTINPIARVCIETEGCVNPIELTGLNLTLSSSEELADIASVEIFDGGSVDALSFKTPNSVFANDDQFGKPSPAAKSITVEDRKKLQYGKNYFWVSVQLSDKANIDGWIDAGCSEVRFADGQIIKPEVTDPPQRQKLGIALRNDGQDDAEVYRIPGIATTNKRTLIAVYDVRYRGWKDLPGNIDVAISRSTDGGYAWEPMKIIMDMGNDPKWSNDGIGDPCVLVDAKTSTIWVSALWSHGDRGWAGSGPGLEPEETGQFILVKSDDDGKTWSKPINITKQIKQPEWCLVLPGPGTGITMVDGTIVFPAQYQDTLANERVPHSTIVYSMDHGQTWHMGTGAKSDTTECRVVELEPGTLMLNMRDNRGGSRAIHVTSDLGRTWREHPSTRSALPEPICNAGLIKVKDTNDPKRPWLAFVNPAVDNKPRRLMTLKLSTDGGLTWPKQHQLLLDQGQSAGYPSLTMIDDETIGVLYEGSRAHVTFQRIPLDDLVGSD